MSVLGTKESVSKVYLPICFLKYDIRVFQKPTSLGDLEQLEFVQLIEINTTSNALTNDFTIAISIELSKGDQGTLM